MVKPVMRPSNSLRLPYVSSSTLLNQHVNTFLEQARAFSFQQIGDAAGSQQLAVQVFENLR
jgi:hypothetical protein